MTQDRFEHGMTVLTEGNPGIAELRDLHRQLSSDHAESAYPVEQYALAAAIQSMLEYLDFVSMELEKSIGLQSEAERERILESLHGPEASDPYLQIDQLITQWESFERYSQADVARLVDEGDR